MHYIFEKIKISHENEKKNQSFTRKLEEFSNKVPSRDMNVLILTTNLTVSANRSPCILVFEPVFTLFCEFNKEKINQNPWFL